MHRKVGEARSVLVAAEDFAEGQKLIIPYSGVVDNIRNAKHEVNIHLFPEEKAAG